MKAPFSPYLTGIAPGLKQLIALLRRRYDYVSVLSTDSVGFTVRISQRYKGVARDTRTTLQYLELSPEEMLAQILAGATDENLVAGLVQVKRVNTGSANIAGVAIPTFESIETAVKDIDLWATPAWVDDAVKATTGILALQCERAVYEEQKRLVTIELQTTSQRVNLFEKVKIPECKEAIRLIKIALGDEQTSAVTRGKIAKGRTPKEDAE